MKFLGMDFSRSKSIQEADKTRLEIKGPLSKSDIQWLLGHKTVRVLQTAEPLNKKSLELLNSDFFAKRPEVQFRVYGFYGLDCDLDALGALTEVRSLSIDCLRQARNIAAACKLPKIREFGLGVYFLDSFECLEFLPLTLENLSLWETKSKKPALQGIGRFKNLRSLGLTAQMNGIEAIQGLSFLEKVSFRSITLKDLGLLEALPKLWSFDLKLGGTKNLEALARVKNLKYLEIWRVLGLGDLDVLGKLKSLQYLFLQELIRVKKLPSLRALKKLRRVHLEDMKGLSDLKPVADAPVLESLLIIAQKGLDIEDLRPFVGHPSLKSGWIETMNAKKNEKMIELLKLKREPGYSRDFVFKD